MVSIRVNNAHFTAAVILYCKLCILNSGIYSVHVASQAKSLGDKLMHLGGHGMRLCVSIHEPEKLACGITFSDTSNSRIANSAQYCGQMLPV